MALLALLGSACDAPAGRGDEQRADPDRPGHVLGDEGAPVTVVEFSDFGCPYCARFARTTFPELREDYIGGGRVRWRYVPVSFGFPGGALMGAAAECAASLGGERAFWLAHDMFYARQTALRGEDARERILEWLGQAGLDRARLDACLDDPATQRKIEANNAAAAAWRVGGTPTFVINGVPMSGAQPTEFFRKVLDTAIDPSTL